MSQFHLSTSDRLGIMKGALFGFLLAVGSLAHSETASRPSFEQVENIIQSEAIVGFEWVDQPLNRVLLIRNGRTVCAIRFRSYRLENDARTPSSFDSGDASRFSSYEIAELVVRGDKIEIGPVSLKELSYKGLRGLGRLAFGVGDDEVRCGRERYSWLFPTGILLKSQEVSVAPTNWKKFEDVRLDHPNLRWYSRDQDLRRPIIFIPFDELAQ